MKLQVEIDGDKFKYAFAVGGSQQNSEMPLSATGLCLFTDLLRKCADHQQKEWEEKRDKSWARALAEDLKTKPTPEEKKDE